MQLMLDGMPAGMPTRHLSPGDIVKRPRRYVHEPGHAPRPRAASKIKPRPNPFRQPIADDNELGFRHLHWNGLRRIVRKHMHAAGTPTTAMDRFDNCGAECTVEWSPSLKKHRLRASYCHCRHCRPCMRTKGNLIAMRLKAKLEAGTAKAGDRFRFITLTLRHTRAPLSDQIDNLYRHFRILRSTRIWKSSQRGGAAMLEVKIGDDGLWHPHLHIVAEGDFIRQDKLANEWMRVTGGSFKVDVRAVNSSKDAAFYVSKYVSKGTPDDVWRTDDHAQEWITASKGLHSCATFGCWRGYKLTARCPSESATDWIPIGILSRIVEDCRAGNVGAYELLSKLEDAIQYNPGKARHTSAKPPE